MIPLDEIRRARERLGGDVLRTPLVPFGADERLRLKLECLQPVGSFNLRGALSALRAASPAELASGVVTASAGNMAQGVAWAAREAGVAARVICPDGAPRAKIERVEALGAEVVPVTHEEW
ncbi:MAG TPA: pyridoxal-phosphate dependent enzyme, partial [Gaiellaceae bacterium]|nr:pyridoxal-phosphate dependent enzyme [Gaiellaceae bacterium]